MLVYMKQKIYLKALELTPELYRLKTVIMNAKMMKCIINYLYQIIIKILLEKTKKSFYLIQKLNF